MRSNLWASGYDVDGTDQTSLGQFSGRVQQTYKHSVPRFFVPEHGTMFTLALVRFPPTATKEIQYFFFKGEVGIRDVAVTGVQTCALPIRSPAQSCLPGPRWSRGIAGQRRSAAPIPASAAKAVFRAACDLVRSKSASAPGRCRSPFP